jgi:hypothetical protein
MKSHPDQCSLFDEPEPEPLPASLSPPDPSQLQQMIELIGGEPRVLDTRLGAWLGFKDPLDARQFIRRSMTELSSLGILAHRELNLGRRGRPAIAFLLNQAQVNHVITYCGLPNLSELRVLVTKVFTAWQSGHLAATDATTTIDLQDAVAAAEEQMPGSTQLGALTERLGRVEQVATEAFTVGHQALKLAQSAAPTKYPGPADEPRAGDPSTWRPIHRKRG